MYNRKEKVETILKNLSRDIAEIARSALKSIVASKRLPTPLVYESEFIDAARKLKKDRVLKYLVEDEKNLEQQFSAVLSEAGGLLSSLQLSISMFEEENRENVVSIDRSVDSILEYSGQAHHKDGLQKLLDEVTKLQATNHQLMESLAETKKDLSEKEEVIKDLESQSQIDPLTQLLNRRSWNKRIEQEFERSKRYGNAFSVIMIDIDHFKRFNDFYGHQIGDAVLMRFGSLLKETVRKIDAVFRYGGEEFTVLLPETTLGKAQVVAQRILDTINSTLFTDEKKGLELKVTASFGIADSLEKGSVDAIVEAADQALYLCKHSGRNCIRTEKALI